MTLVSKIKIKTSAINIKELYIGFKENDILHLVELYKYDSIYEGKLYFNYKEDYTIFFKIIPINNGIREFYTEKYELKKYEPIYKLEINEKVIKTDNMYSDYEYTIYTKEFKLEINEEIIKTDNIQSKCEYIIYPYEY